MGVRAACQGASMKTVMRTRSLFALLTAAVLACPTLVACMKEDPHPPQAADCTGGATTCVGPVAGGSGGNSNDAGGGTSSCAVNAVDSMCNQCAEANCCSPLAACMNDPNCSNLYNCELTCAGSSSCIATRCVPGSTGVVPLQTLMSCLTGKCPVCSQFGAGDPCGGADCNPGLTCGEEGCSKACTHSTDCVGLGPSGDNVLGFPNSCVPTNDQGERCFPGCTVDGDCAGFPGTFCFITNSAEQTQVSVCWPMPDAATAD
jgi:hypothetical protein